MGRKSAGGTIAHKNGEGDTIGKNEGTNELY